MSFALLHDGIVIEIQEHDFPVASPLTWVEIPKGMEVETGYIYDDGIFSQSLSPISTPVTVDPIEDKLDLLVARIEKLIKLNNLKEE